MASPTKFFEQDGPYSWIVLITLILCNFSSFGFLMGTLGPLSDLFPQVFDRDQAETNIISSTALAVFSFAIPIETLVMKVVGCRVTAIAGALLTIIGMVSAAFCTQIWQLVIAYSVITYLGVSSTYTSSIGVIPHYFTKRKDAAYTGLGLGVGIAFTAYPYMTESVFSTFGYRDGILCLLPVFICSVAAAVVFIPQLPAEKPESFPQLMKSYLQTAKHFVTQFYLINATLMMGSRSGFAVNYFAFLSSHFEQRTATISYTIHGVSFLISMILFTLYGLKFNGNYLVFHLLTCFVFGIAICIIPIIHNVIIIYVVSAFVGTCYGLSFGFKGNVTAHLFPLKDVTGLYGLTEGLGGFGAFVIPYAAGHIDKNVTYGDGLYFIGACVIFASILLCVATVFRPALWTPYEKRINGSENRAQTHQPDKFGEPEKPDEPEKLCDIDESQVDYVIGVI